MKRLSKIGNILAKLLLLLLGATLPLTVCACSRPAASNESYRVKSFTARLEGNQFGVELSCDISCENGSFQRVIYHAPEALNGVEITRLSDGSLRLERDGVSTVFSEDDAAFDGLLLPARMLLLKGADPTRPRSVQRLSSGQLLTLDPPDGSPTVTVTLGEDGFPTAISDERCAFRVCLVSLHSPAFSSDSSVFCE